MKRITYSKFFRLFGVALFTYILSKINLNELLLALKQADPIYCLIGLLFLIFGFLVRVLRWRLLVDSIGAKTSFNELAEMSIKGFFFGLITPAKMGEFWRAKYLSEKSKASKGKAFYTAFLDRATDILVVIIIGLFSFVIIPFKFTKIWNWQLPVLVLFFSALLIYFLSAKQRTKKISDFLIKLLVPEDFKEKTNFFLNELYQGFNSLNLSLFFKVLFLGFIYYILSGAVFAHLIILSLGIIIPFWYVFLVVALVWLIIAIPVSIFGLGAREASYIYFFSFFNIPVSLTVTFSLLVLFCNILIIGVPGTILFLKGK